MTDFRDVIRVENLLVDCVVGLYPHERHASQPLRVDLELVLNAEVAALSENVRDTADYASVSSQVVFLLRSARFRLLETAAVSIARLVLAPQPAGVASRVDEVRVRLNKPGALKGFATPSLEIHRTAAWCQVAVEEKPWGTVDVLHETKDAGIYRLNIAPGAEIPLHVHRVMRESDMVLTEGLHCQNEYVPPGTVFRWPRGAAHVYRNPSRTWQSILCVDLPRFLPEDEIAVTGEPFDVTPEPPWGPVPG